jgi:large subunit ribosomal protein L17
MRHRKSRHKLSRDTGHRKALLRNLCREVIEHERIETSQAKAKAAKPEMEKLITLGKRGDLHARRQALSRLGQDKFLVHKLFEEIAPRYAERRGGYTRIVKLGPRWGDAAEMVYLELVDYVPPAPRPKRVREEVPAELEEEPTAAPGVTT